MNSDLKFTQKKSWKMWQIWLLYASKLKTKNSIFKNILRSNLIIYDVLRFVRRIRGLCSQTKKFQIEKLGFHQEKCFFSKKSNDEKVFARTKILYGSSYARITRRGHCTQYACYWPILCNQKPRQTDLHASCDPSLRMNQGTFPRGVIGSNQ